MDFPKCTTISRTGYMFCGFSPRFSATSDEAKVECGIYQHSSIIRPCLSAESMQRAREEIVRAASVSFRAFSRRGAQSGRGQFNPRGEEKSCSKRIAHTFQRCSF